MAVSAFKSSSRRTNPTNPSPSSSSSSSSAAAARTGRPSAAAKPATCAATRRSRSVSAFSRCAGSSSSGHAEASPSSAEDFLNKRDNPLFWSNASPPDLETAAADSTKKRVSTAGSTDGGGEDGRRGRSVARKDGGLGSAGGRKEVGRSLSRVDTGRRNRSLSRCPVSRGRFVNSEGEAEQECSSVVTKNRRGLSMEVDSDDQDERDLVRNGSGFDAVDQTKGLRRWSTQHSASEPPRDSALDLSRSDPATSSLFGVEEKTIKAVCEQMKSSIRGDPLEGDAHGAATGIYETVRSEVRRAISEIQNDLERAIGRSNSSAIANANIIDIPPDLVNPSAVELVLDIRREYAKKLEQSQERARKLRADLAVEEHRGLELSRILKEVLPDPKTPSVQKSRPVRKASMERRKMSKRLTEEAMAYFDECVSLSTFDSSDFSSQEDPPLNIVGTTTPVANYVLSLHASSGALDTTSSNSYFKDKQQHSSTQDQMSNIRDAAELMASTSYNEPHLDQFSPTNINAAWDWKSPFSFARKPTKTPYIQQDIQKYIKDSEKGIERSNINLHFVRSKEYDLGEYHSHAAAQSFVFDRVVMRNGIESGNLLLCSGSVSVSFSPFASFF